jgi:diadenosine tetraphosphate (Ap4A) HIT family hydrolase
MTWQDLTGRRVRIDGEPARVVHVDSFRVILMTEPGDGAPPHRMVVPQDDLVDVEELDEQGED